MNNNKETALGQTPLHPMHLQLGARMVPFAGYDMPVNYPGGIMSEHRHTRDSAGLFDVSHMGQIEVRGEHVAARLESELPVDLVGLPVGRQRYALLLNDDGGIRDDLMAINRGDSFWLVVNAACKHADLDYLERKLGTRLDFTLREDLALLALQGPASPGALAAVGADTDALERMRFMQVGDLRLAGVDCMVSRSGYTGEDGFEISLPADRAASLAGALLEQAAVAPVGLGARDSLRLEAGLCLYGQDIGPETSPVEAGLRWAISPARRSGGARPGGFPGADRILGELDRGAERRLVGLLPEGRAPMRAGTPLFGDNGEALGEITSGGFGPTLERPLSMGYVPLRHARPGTMLAAEVRNRRMPVSVTAMPFVPQRYRR